MMRVAILTVIFALSAGAQHTPPIQRSGRFDSCVVPEGFIGSCEEYRTLKGRPPTIQELSHYMIKSYSGPEPIGVRAKRDKWRPVPRFSSRQIADCNFWLQVAGMTLTNLFDMAATHHCVRVNPACKEGNPLERGRPSWGKMLGLGLGLESAAVGTLYLYKKIGMEQAYFGEPDGLPGWWFLPQMWNAAHIGAGIYALTQAHCPSGTVCR
jgi:hypothetical protein